MRTLTRRHALAAAGSSVLAAAAPAAGAATAAADPTVAAWCAAAGSEGVFAIGRRCLELGQVEADVPELARELERATAEWRDGHDPAALRTSLRRAVTGEFRGGDIVRIDGWVLSKSEVRFYALSALVDRPS